MPTSSPNFAVANLFSVFSLQDYIFFLVGGGFGKGRTTNMCIKIIITLEALFPNLFSTIDTSSFLHDSNCFVMLPTPTLVPSLHS